MTITMDSERTRTKTPFAWPTGTRSPFDVMAALDAGLPPGWEAWRGSDVDRDTFVVVMNNDPAMASFIFYERDGYACVGTVKADAWEGTQAFVSCQDAVAAIIGAAAT